MANPVSLKETLVKMANFQEESVTLNWDVIVNYAEPDINKLLAETYRQGDTQKQLKDLPFKVNVYNPLWNLQKFKHLNLEKYYDIDYDLKLAAPLLKFEVKTTEPPTCSLTYPVNGGNVGGEGGDPEVVPPNRYEVVIKKLALATANQSTDKANPFHESYIFDERKKQGHVIIDFETSGDIDVKFNKLSLEEFSTIDENIPSIQESIKKQVLDKGKYRYEIARVNAQTPPKGMIQLKPKSFRFDAFLPSEASGAGDIGVLTLFIKTRDSNPKQELATAWRNQWRNDEMLHCSPIPTGHTASIIFSKRTIFESVIKPALETQGFSGTLEGTKGCLAMKIDTQKHVKRPKFRQTDDYACDAYVEYRTSEIDVTLDPLDLTLSDVAVKDIEDATNSCTVVNETSWKFKYDCDWSKSIGPAGGVGGPYTEQGTVHATHTHPKASSKPRKTTTLLDDYSVTMECSVSKDDWDAEFEAKETALWEVFLGKFGGLPEWVTSLDVGLPDFTLDLGSFDFFLTTNLLFPGDQKVIKIDTKAGVRIPGDLYVVGKVLDKVEKRT